MMPKREQYTSKENQKRKVKNIILIVCGGKTEKVYFDKFKSRVAQIRVEPVINADSPLNIVKYAIEIRTDECLETWVVFDKDNFDCFDKAISMAEDHGVKVAFSNQAFELWFILHFKRLEGGFHRDNYEYEINKLLKRDRKNKFTKPYDSIFPCLKSKMENAITYAKIGHQKHIRDNYGMSKSKWESCTIVYELVDRLIKIK